MLNAYYRFNWEYSTSHFYLGNIIMYHTNIIVLLVTISLWLEHNFSINYFDSAIYAKLIQYNALRLKVNIWISEQFESLYKIQALMDWYFIKRLVDYQFDWTILSPLRGGMKKMKIIYKYIIT